jgi:sugar phosphate isomerase/epimerase
MKNTVHPTTRRGFCRQGALAVSGVFLASRVLGGQAVTGKKLFSAMGIAASLDRAAALKAQGADFLTLSTGDFLVPDKPDAEFAKNLAKLADSPLPVLACNGFIRPKHLRCVGADANHDEILAWAGIAFRRLKVAGGKFIVFGSAGARALKDDWPKDKADAQFVALLKRMGPLAAEQGITVAVEQLQASECNYINRIGEGAALIRETSHPNIRLLADLYHMARMGDAPQDLKAAMDVVVHVEIAEKDGRTFPGVKGDDFRPFFRVLREAGYQGAINIEGNGIDEQVAPAFREIAKQAAEA